MTIRNGHACYFSVPAHAASSAFTSSTARNGCSASADMASSISTAFIRHLALSPMQSRFFRISFSARHSEPGITFGRHRFQIPVKVLYSSDGAFCNLVSRPGVLSAI